jgi:folate-binding protein YgfZ
MPLISTPALSFIDVVGADAIRVANNLCTAPLLQLTAQSGCEAFFTDIRGKTLGHFCVYATDNGLRLIGAANQAEKIAAHFDRYTIREDATVVDHSDSTASYLIDAQTFLQLEPSIEFGQPFAPNFFSCRTLQTDGEEESVVAYQVPWLGMNAADGGGLDGGGLDGGGLVGGPAVLLAGAPEAMKRWLRRSEASLQTLGTETMDVAQFHLLRVKAGFPWYGVDLDDKNLPQELDRDALAISFNKGCYLGQETVARLDALGQVQKKLVVWQVDAANCPPADTQLIEGENVVGRLTSIVPGDSAGRWLALGYARRSHFEPGSTAQWKDQGQAVVQKAPWI